jgi:hypothetical protein
MVSNISTIRALLPMMLERVLDDEVDFVEFERLRDVVVGAQLHGLHRGLGRGHRGDHDDCGIRGKVLGGSEDLKPIHLRHAQVGDDCVEGLAAYRLDRGRAPFGQGHVVARLLQGDGQQVPHALLVVHYQNPCLAHVYLVSRDRRSALCVCVC